MKCQRCNVKATIATPLRCDEPECPQTAEPPAEKAAMVEATAKALENADREWRKASGYTGSPVHRPAYWWALANHLIANPPTP